MHSVVETEDTTKRKPNTVTQYNKTKCDVDVMDQMVREYSVGAGTRRWPVAVFYNMIDMAALNAHVLYQACIGVQERRVDFLVELAKELGNSHVSEKKAHKEKLLRQQPSTPSPGKRAKCQVNHRCTNNCATVRCVDCYKYTCGKCTRDIPWQCQVSSDPPSPTSGSLSLGRHECLKFTSEADMKSKPISCQASSPVQEVKKQNGTSSSSNLKHLLTPGLHLPYSGQQGVAEEHKRRSQSTCATPHTAGGSTSAQQSKKRSCSEIPESSAEIFRTSCELEKENAHFIVVDMVLEKLESAKWTLSLDQWLSTMDTHHDTHCQMCRHTSSAQDSSPHKQTCTAQRRAGDCSTEDPRQQSNKRRHPHEDVKTAHRDTHSYVQDQEEKARKDVAQHQIKTLSMLSTDSGFEDCGADHTFPQRETLRNAEQLAQHLVLEFKRSWLPSNELQRGRQSLRSSLQELPGTGGVAVSSSSLTEEIRQRTRMRGSLNWAPPRFQIIFTVQPTLRRREVVALQHFLCAGCGTEVEPRYIKKLRYCEYLGRYFCDCCHSNSEAVIPGRVLSCWDFGRYPVSDFSKQLLDSVWHQPLFDLTCVGKTLYGKVKELDRFRELQDQLLGIKKLLTACRLSGSTVAELEDFPAHLREQPNLFSMDDLQKLKKGQLAAQTKAVLHSAIAHVENCELCLARGFICEFCREKDVVFPFQSDICKRCPVCKACFHKKCFVEKKCPKCTRIQARKNHWDGSMKSNT
ncbi:protein associated with UVRAG as autophagy enhancer-like [Archocentrus centrarchus]|uniref:protein associated with UVRAG as autophagy enhancer-like n=1 Tax=Archocentrus centrarchus TaxID=63155 RepID=UPI0011EA00D4|nr:protein associated with UVRAG as autophagy enhancer-like [Archocentrus centrarchus]